MRLRLHAHSVCQNTFQTTVLRVMWGQPWLRRHCVLQRTTGKDLKVRKQKLIKTNLHILSVPLDLVVKHSAQGYNGIGLILVLFIPRTFWLPIPTLYITCIPNNYQCRTRPENRLNFLWDHIYLRELHDFGKHNRDTLVIKIQTNLVNVVWY